MVRSLRWFLKRGPLIVGTGLLGVMLVRALYWMSDWSSVVALITQADHAIYMRQAARILGGGPVYPAWELAGPFGPDQLPEVYPPLTVFGLIVPLSFLPAPVWWAVPLVVVGLVVFHHRPGPWARVAVLAILALPASWETIAAGNPSLWAVAAMALATIRPSLAAFVMLKPTLAPFAIIGSRQRSWWFAIAGLAVISLAMFPLWREWVTVASNYRASPLPVKDIPLMLIPLVAWVGPNRPRRPVDSQCRAGPTDG